MNIWKQSSAVGLFVGFVLFFFLIYKLIIVVAFLSREIVESAQASKTLLNGAAGVWKGR